MEYMEYLLSLDQGTTSSRALIFDENGKVVALEQKEFKQYFPQSGYVEHDPMEIWESEIGVAKAALAKASLSGKNIAAIGITNQRETTIIWDRKTGKPIYPAIVWQDRRTADLCQKLKKHELLFRKKNRPPTRSLFFWHKDPLDPRQCKRSQD